MVPARIAPKKNSMNSTRLPISMATRSPGRTPSRASIAGHAIHALVELPVGRCALAPAEQVDDRDLVRQPPHRFVEKEPRLRRRLTFVSFIVSSCVSPAMEFGISGVAKASRGTGRETDKRRQSGARRR